MAKKNDIGKFMVAVGAVIRLKETNKILLIQRADNLDWLHGEWEIVYGRMNQHEDLKTALIREVKEETGINDLKIGDVVRVWHTYRGKKKIEENELVGITYFAETAQEKVTISLEHQAYKWVAVDEAISTVVNDGIRKDIVQCGMKYIVFSSCCGGGGCGSGGGCCDGR